MCDSCTDFASNDSPGGSIPTSPEYVPFDIADNEHAPEPAQEVSMIDALLGYPNIELAAMASGCDVGVCASLVVRMEFFAGDADLPQGQRTEPFLHTLDCTAAELRRCLEATDNLTGPLEIFVYRQTAYARMGDADVIEPGSVLVVRPACLEHRGRLVLMHLNLKHTGRIVRAIVGPAAKTRDLVALFLSKVDLRFGEALAYFLTANDVPVLLSQSVLDTPAQSWAAVPGGSEWRIATVSPTVNEVTERDSCIFANPDQGKAMVTHHTDAEYQALMRASILCDPTQPRTTVGVRECDHAWELYRYYCIDKRKQK